MAKRKTDKPSATEASDSDNWLASFADARHILRTRFKNGGDLGDGPVRRSGIRAVRQALSCLDLCRDIVGEVTNSDVRQRLSIAIQMLISDVTLSAPAGNAAEDFARERLNDEKRSRSTRANGGKKHKHSSRVQILDEVILNVVGKDFPEKLSVDLRNKVITQTQKRLTAEQKGPGGNWPTRNTVDRRVEKLFMECS